MSDINVQIFKQMLASKTSCIVSGREPFAREYGTAVLSSVSSWSTTSCSSPVNWISNSMPSTSISSAFRRLPFVFSGPILDPPRWAMMRGDDHSCRQPPILLLSSDPDCGVNGLDGADKGVLPHTIGDAALTAARNIFSLLASE